MRPWKELLDVLKFAQGRPQGTGPRFAVIFSQGILMLVKTKCPRFACDFRFNAISSRIVWTKLKISNNQNLICISTETFHCWTHGDSFYPSFSGAEIIADQKNLWRALASFRSFDRTKNVTDHSGNWRRRFVRHQPIRISPTFEAFSHPMLRTVQSVSTSCRRSAQAQGSSWHAL